MARGLVLAPEASLQVEGEAVVLTSSINFIFL